MVYIADLQVKRPVGTESRRFDILISVSNKDKWESVKIRLEAALNLLTGDTFNFVFTSSGSGTIGDGDCDEKSGDPDRAICLFSGGLDSLSGAVWLLRNNITPTLISHLSNPSASGAQIFLSGELNRISEKKLDFYQIHAKAKKNLGLGHKEHSQMSRSFLYLSIAVVFAVSMRISKIFLFENGVLAMNIPITTSRIYLNTKTAFPGFIQRFNELIERIFVCFLKVENPFLTRTKSEVISTLDVNGYWDLIRNSISCSEIRQLTMQGVKVSQVNHCGKCYPCILRRVSVYHAGLERSDSNYHVDISDFNNMPIDGKKLLLELADFFRKLSKCQTDDEVLDEFPAFYVENEDPEQLIGAYKRYNKEFRKFVSDKGARGLKQNLQI